MGICTECSTEFEVDYFDGKCIFCQWEESKKEAEKQKGLKHLD